MITRIVAACARRPYVVLAAAALTGAAGYASQRGAGARRDSGSVESAAGAGGRMDGASRARGRGARDRGIDRRARGCARVDDGARLVDGGDGLRRRRVQVRRRRCPRGAPRIVRRVAALRPRLPAAVHIQVGPEASATGWVLQYALRPPERKQAMPMGEAKHRGPGAEIRPLREFQDKVLRPALVGIPGVAEVAHAGRRARRGGRPDHRRRAARRGRRLFGRRDRAARAAAIGRPGRPGRTISSTTRRSAS